jgi:hypothetical protein
VSHALENIGDVCDELLEQELEEEHDGGEDGLHVVRLHWIENLQLRAGA